MFYIVLCLLAIIIIYTLSQKTALFSFEHNFRKYMYCSILIILSQIEFPTSPIVCCCTTLKNAITYTSSQKLLSKSAFNTCGNFVVVTKQEILVISLTLFFDIASWLHNDVILTSVSVYLFTTPSLFKNGALLTHATVELLRQEMPNFLASKLWSPNRTDLSPVDYEIWAVMQHCVYQTNPQCGKIETAAHQCLAQSWTVDFWLGYWPVVRKTSSMCP